MNGLVQLHQEYENVLKTDTKILAISVDNPEKAEAMKEKTGVEFDLLCDENLEVIKAYHLVDEQLAGWDYIDGKSRKTKEARNIALSANIIIDKNGTILSDWRGHYNFRPSATETIDLLKKI